MHLGWKSAVGLSAALWVAGCTQSVDVVVTEATGVYEADASETRIAFRTSQSIDKHIDSDEVRPASGEIFICGQNERYSSEREIRRTPSGVYEVILPGMAQRTEWEPEGRVVAGWPADLARHSGVCFRVQAAEMLWLTLDSNIVVLPR